MARQTPTIAQPVTPSPTGSFHTVLVGDFGGPVTMSLFRSLLETGLTLVYVENRLDLVARAIAARPLAVIVPICDHRGWSSVPLIARLRTEVPDVRAITLWRPEDRALLVDAIRAGGELVMVRSPADLVACLRGLRRLGSLSGAETDAVRSLLIGLQPAWLVEILLAAVRGAHCGLSIDDLAALAGVSRRTLCRHASEAKWPAPEELIEWGRLLRASLIQWRYDSSLVALAHASGFSGAQRLHRATARLIGFDAVVPSALSPLAVSRALRKRLASLAR
jgi:AraC-like DNA-binding protein